MRSESPTLSVRSARSLDEPRPKMQCIDDRYDYQTLVEYADVDGIEECMKQLRALQATTLTDKEFRRSEFYLQYLAAIVEQYGLPVPGPKDIPAQYLRCKYRMRNGGGRLYPHGMRTLQDRGEARSVCIQSAPRELRPFLCCRWGIDIDMISAHASSRRLVLEKPSKRTVAESAPWVIASEWPFERMFAANFFACLHAFTSLSGISSFFAGVFGG